MFRVPLEVVVGEVDKREGFVFADVLPARAAAACGSAALVSSPWSGSRPA
jgi:hypothetical protein